MIEEKIREELSKRNINSWEPNFKKVFEEVVLDIITDIPRYVSDVVNSVNIHRGVLKAGWTIQSPITKTVYYVKEVGANADVVNLTTGESLVISSHTECIILDKGEEIETTNETSGDERPSTEGTDTV